MIKFSRESKMEIARMTTLIFFCLFEIITLSLALFMTSIKIEFAKKMFQTQISLGFFASGSLLCGVLYTIFKLSGKDGGIKSLINDIDNLENGEINEEIKSVWKTNK